MLPNKWGQGQLFVFSALDGTSLYSDDLVGTLSGDRIGIRFHTKAARELAVVGYHAHDLVFRAVTSDYIRAELSGNRTIRILYHDTHLVIGDLPEDACAVVFPEGKAKIIEIDGVQLQDTGDGEYTALAASGTKFAFAYARSAEEAVRKAKNGLCADIDASEQKKCAFFEKNTLSDDCKYNCLYSKCLSVMKSQLYSPEEEYDRIWSTPDRLPHKNLWLWDSVFHALGHRNIDGKLAEDLILDIFVGQYDNGMIPHMANIYLRSNITQPPVIAWGAWNVYQTTHNKEFLRAVFSCNGRFLSWCQRERKPAPENLYVWHTAEDITCRCDESGMDNSPRFDNVVHLQAIDFSCFMANEMRHMARIAKELGEDPAEYLEQFESIKAAINAKLWDAEDGFYYDYDLDNERIHKVEAVSSFLPLFAGVCDEKQADSLIKWLLNPETFWTAFPIPSISVRDKTFGSDMWRGPVWINYNYMIIQGLREYGYADLADEILHKTLDVINEWYQKDGTLYEFYNSENKFSPRLIERKGPVVEPYNPAIRYQSIRDYGWSCTLTCDLIAQTYGK